MELLSEHNFFGSYHLSIRRYGKAELGRKTAVETRSPGQRYRQNVTLEVNEDIILTPPEWAYLLAHQSMHAAFGHFDAACIIGENRPLLPEEQPDEKLWNLACDLYNMRFMQKMKCGAPPFPEFMLPSSATENERTLYQYLKETPLSAHDRESLTKMTAFVHMEGISSPVVYQQGMQNPDIDYFSAVLHRSVIRSLSCAGEDTPIKKSLAEDEKEWFITHFPLLGGLAASFRIVENYRLCRDHAFLIPSGAHLPFPPQGEVFYFS